MIRVSVSLANASVTETETLTAGRVGLECAFTFSSEWDDLAKVAVFEGAETIEVALGTASVAVVPPECMATAGYNLRVGVYGLSASTAVVIPTIWAKAGKIKDSAAPDDESLAPATPELVAQIIEKSDTALMLAQGVAEQAASGAFIGEPGVSPTISSTVIENGHRLTITDVNGETEVDVMNGTDGAAATVSVGTTTTLAAGSNATVTNSGTSSAAVLNFGIPKGAKGDTGTTPAFSIGSVTTGAAGSSAAANITGTDEAPVLNLTIPQGLKGDAGNGDMIADEFSTSTAYAVGDYVIYSGSLYRFTAAHAAGAWNASHATAVQLAEDVGDLKSALDNKPVIPAGSGVSEELKQALLQMAQKVAYIDAQGQTYYQALYDALYSAAVLTSITAAYSQSGIVYTTDTLDSLKPDLTVTAHYDDGTSEVVTNYTLSGNLTVGTSIITVSYGGKTTTFNVTVVKLDYTEDALSTATWNEGMGYEISTGALVTRSGAYATDKFNVQDLSYSIRNLDTTNNTNYYIFVWDENGTYLGNKQYSNARFQWKPEYQIAIEVRNAGTFDPTTMTMLPYDKRATAVNEFEIDLASMASSVVKANGYYEVNVKSAMESVGVNSSNYNDTINRQSIVGMINQSVYPNNFPFNTPIRIGTFNYGTNMLLSINVEGIAVSDANLPTLKAYLVDNNVKIKYNY